MPWNSDEHVAPPEHPAVGDDIARAYHAAMRAGPSQQPLRVLSDTELEAPVELPPEPEAAAEVPAPAVQGYQLLGEISRGGQACVYRARQECTGRTVALKVLAGGPFISSSARARLDREVAALASCGDANVVGILDRGRTADGSHFLVMDFVEGVPLDDWAASWRQSPNPDARALLTLFAKLAAVMDGVHRLGIVHRDLKPSNVLIDRRGEPRVLDFGLALLREAAPDGEGPTVLTLTGQILGSLPWVSPEQPEGESARLDARSDVYSLGVMLHHAATGRFPYPVSGPISQVLQRIRTARPQPPSRHGCAWAGVDAERADGVVLRALEKSPHRRHPSAAAFAADLNALLARRPRGPWRRRAKRVAIAVAIGAAVSVGVAAIAAALVLVSTGPGSRLLSKLGGPVREGLPKVVALPSTTNSLGMVLLRIPAGECNLGTPASVSERSLDEPMWFRRVDQPFYLGRTEVTRGQYRAVMGPAGPPQPDDDLPVADVTWDQAVEFCHKLGEREHQVYRLPTEVEWEYACRAGSVEPFGAGVTLDRVGWYYGNSSGQPHPVAQLAPNTWGLYDMHGGVAEWCDDVMPAPRPSPSASPLPPRRVVRGGGFLSPPDLCRAARRFSHPADKGNHDLGFRVVREL